MSTKDPWQTKARCFLYCFFIIEHDRRKILHFNITEQPTSPWIVQQLREAFPESCPYRYAILDADAKFGREVTDVLRAEGIAGYWSTAFATGLSRRSPLCVANNPLLNFSLDHQIERC